jgi:hypothetical protein
MKKKQEKKTSQNRCDFIKYNKVLDAANGHYKQWVVEAIGLWKTKLSSPFEITGPLTEVLLIVNLAMRS